MAEVPDCGVAGAMSPQKQHRGIAGVILAIGVALALIITTGTAVAAVVSNGKLTESGAALLSTALGTAIGALATYLGGNRATDELPNDNGLADQDREDRDG